MREITVLRSFPPSLKIHTVLNNKTPNLHLGVSISPHPTMTEMVKGALSCFAQWPLTNIKKY